MIRALIIDDEQAARDRLRQLLSAISDIEIIGEAEDGEGAIAKIGEMEPDLVFLDIQMPGASGLDMLEKLPEINFEVIFVTAFDEFAIKAIKLAALDYLLKPINIEELKSKIYFINFV